MDAKSYEEGSLSYKVRTLKSAEFTKSQRRELIINETFNPQEMTPKARELAEHIRNQRTIRESFKGFSKAMDEDMSLYAFGAILVGAAYLLS